MILEPTQIRIDLHEHPRWRRTLDVGVPEEVVLEERDKAFEQLARRMKVPGFRKGKAPPAAIERHAPAVMRETLQRIVDEAYRVALQNRALQPISEGQIEAVDYQPGGGLVFRVSFDVAPAIELSTLGGFTVERPRIEVTDEDVEDELTRVRIENAIWRPAEDGGEPIDGDLVTIQIVRIGEDGSPESDASAKGSLGDVGLPWVQRLRLRADSKLGNRFQFVLGDGDALPDLEDAVRSLTTGETRDFTIMGAEPPLRLRVTLDDRRMRDLPALDDAFARSLGAFQGVEGLRVQVREALEQQAADAAEQHVRARLLQQVLMANPFDVPSSMVERYIDAKLGDTRGADPRAVERARAALRGEAEAQVKRTLVVDRIAEIRGLSATPEDVDRRIAQIAEVGRVDPEQVRSRLLQSNRLGALVADVTEGKVLDLLQSLSRIVDEEA